MRSDMTDHDLLIHLDATVNERLKNLDEKVSLTFGKVLEKITEVASKLDLKADRHELFLIEKEVSRHNDRLNILFEEMEKIKHIEIATDARKQAYLNIASLTWKEWGKVAALITVTAAIIKNL